MEIVKKLLHWLGAWQSTGRLLGLAAALSVMMAVELAASNGLFAAWSSGSAPWTALALLGVFAAASTAAIVIGFTISLRPDASRVAAAIACGAIAAVAGLETSHALSKLPLLFYFGASLVAEVALTYGAAVVWMRSLKLTGSWSQRAPRAACGLVAAVGAGGVLGQSFLSLDAVAINLALARDLALFATAAGTVLALACYRPLRLDHKSRRESIRLRFPSGHDAGGRAFQVFCLGLGAAPAVQLIVRASGATSLMPLTVATLAGVGIAWQGFAELVALATEQRQGNVTARLATSSARKFLSRHMSDGSQWAATVGIRTSNFVIDHDPDATLHAQLPASILQIRAEEIGRCVVDVLGAMNLHSHALGHRIAGAVDPEASLRPCIDALRLFATLYLDAGPLVERRIKGLMALLPIVDPGLAAMLKAKDIDSLIRRNHWFFHFDFGWLDQHVVHTPKLTRYDVRIGGLSSRRRHAMMDHLQRNGGVGNFVWIGRDARDRLVQEAPALGNVLEACPISDGGDELLMFTIKFEQLIPRLQRYYDLDSLRRALMDFEPSPESARLGALLRLQIGRAQTATELGDALTAIASVPWRGFREKDNALQLVLAVYRQAEAKLGGGGDGGGDGLGAARDAKVRSLQDKLLDAVRVVGYPSQVLHNAQIDKLQLRDVAKLLGAAGDRQSARFEEAWLLLATTDFTRYPSAQCLAVHHFLQKTAARPALAHRRLVQAKAVDALAALARRTAQNAGEAAEVGRTLDALGRWFGAAPADPDVCCQLLDTKLYMSAQLGLNVDFGAESLAALDRAFRAMADEMGAGHPKVVGLMSRWQEYRSRLVGEAA